MTGGASSAGPRAETKEDRTPGPSPSAALATAVMAVLLLGTFSERVAGEAEIPVFVVRKEG